MRSDVVKKGIGRAPHRALLRAVGCSSADWNKPFIGVINSFNDIVPGHIHLQSIASAVKEGVREEVACLSRAILSRFAMVLP